MENTVEEHLSKIIDTSPAQPLDQLISDQRLILGLLQKRFEYLSDIPQIAERLWHSTDNAWAGSDQEPIAPRDQSLGTEFLNTLIPCGRSVTSIHANVRARGTRFSFDQDTLMEWITEENLVISRQILEDWIREFNRYSSPWDEDPSSKSLDKREIDREPWLNQVCERWPKVWEFSPLGEPDRNYGNTTRVYYACPSMSRMSDPISYTPMESPIQRLPEAPEESLPGSHKYGVFMHYMRSFTIMDFEETPIIKGSPATGLKCKRENIGFKAFYSEDTECLVERRYSTALNIFPIHSPSGHYVLLSLIDAGEHEYGVWSHSPTNDITSYNRWKPWKRYGIYPAAIYSGVSVFQLQICSFIESWESDWNNTLTRINQMVSVKLDVLNDDRRLRELVLDTNPTDLVLYFKVLQMLGRIDDIIQADTARLESLSLNVRNPVISDHWWQKTYKHNEDTQRILEYNWDLVRKRQQRATDRLCSMIKQTKEEVKGLMDSLYNVQSVTEAQKTRVLSKYLMVFTIVTVIFLPPTFAATFFGMDAFQSVETASTQRTFWTVLGILSGLTYVIAGIGLFGAKASTQLREERKKKSKSHGRRDTLQARQQEEIFSEVRIHRGGL
ncbi:hypothetical protein BBK36DRAFT_1170546 [Trichoderma citrinoviride]|uniref:Cora-domain-containing protein n=1 Tax=Trichoderma citrinoviride TaxID=58853 RepID=A0A2T4B6B0_9HYPO|nr:hypothetical protein BBK36DRAFT_1170546 [Trichoderma citrinoviride]PTB64876.1 hypothetical protein BBK36DRAFT_1170546 [Trichoderma citrinoviride]